MSHNEVHHDSGAAVIAFSQNMRRHERNQAFFVRGLPTISESLTIIEEGVSQLNDVSEPYLEKDERFAELESAVVDAVSSLRRYIDQRQVPTLPDA